MATNKTIKVICSVDSANKYKELIMAFESEKELRDVSVIEEIGKQIEMRGFGVRGICNSVAWELVHHGRAHLDSTMGEFDFVIDDVELF